LSTVTTSFDLARQRDFARLSGDWNPLHVDQVFARRTLYGAPVVHGVHLALWALDNGLANGDEPAALRSLKVRFHKAVPLDTRIEIEPAEVTESGISFRAGERQFELTATLADECESCWGVDLPEDGAALSCREATFADASACEGEIPLYLDRGALGRLFPAVAARLPAVQVAQLLASTRLTGMICPGRRSIFHDLEMSFGGNDESLQMRYRNRQSDPRFSIIQLAVTGYGMQGVLTAFFNPTPICQSAMSEVAKVVQPGEFCRQKALVIGGSRGLGELAAKIIAAGGGAVRLTYHQGREDADRVVDELRSFGAEADALPLDIEHVEHFTVQRALPDFRPSDLYYFASPRLEPSQKGVPFSAELFERYRRFYESGLEHILGRVISAGSGPIRVFYPSTATLNAPDDRWREFAAAKADGERIARLYLENHGGGSLYAPRLPWLPTDQTVALRMTKMPNALDVLLPEIRRYSSIDN
jgi:acyl dehydratase